MKTRIFASIIFTAVLASSAAQAGTELSIEETYSGAMPKVTRDDYGLGSYYVESKPSCTQYNLDPLSDFFPAKPDAVSDYLAPQPAHIVCLRNASRG